MFCLSIVGSIYNCQNIFFSIHTPVFLCRGSLVLCFTDSTSHLSKLQISLLGFKFFETGFKSQVVVGVLCLIPVTRNKKSYCSFGATLCAITPCLRACFCRSEMTKDQMVADLAFRSKVLFWSVVILGSVSVGVLGYAVVRYSIFEYILKIIMFLT